MQVLCGDTVRHLLLTCTEQATTQDAAFLQTSGISHCSSILRYWPSNATPVQAASPTCAVLGQHYYMLLCRGPNDHSRDYGKAHSSQRLSHLVLLYHELAIRVIHNAFAQPPLQDPIGIMMYSVAVHVALIHQQFPLRLCSNSAFLSGHGAALTNH